MSPAKEPHDSGAHDLIPQRRSSDCANHNNRIAYIERWMWMLTGGFIVAGLIGVFAINSFFTSQNRWQSVENTMIKLDSNVTRLIVDFNDYKADKKEIEKRVTELERSYHTVQK